MYVIAEFFVDYVRIILELFSFLGNRLVVFMLVFRLKYLLIILGLYSWYMQVMAKYELKVQAKLTLV